MHNSISLIIPVYQADDNLKKCVKRVEQCSPPPGEIILVVDGDTGQVLPNIESVEVKIIRLPETGGPGKARNAGAKEASGDILLFIDADVIVPIDICNRFTTAFTSELKPDAVFGSYDDTPPETDTISQYKNLLHHFTHQHSRSDAFTFWTGCGAILKNRFNELGGFSIDYLQPSIEDIELGYRLKATDGTILLDKTIQVTHLKKWSLGNLVRTDLFLRAIPWSKLILRQGTMNNDMNISKASRMSVVVSWLLLFSLLFMFNNPSFLVLATFFFFIFLFLNNEIFSFFIQKRGALFATKIIPLHILYYLISGLAYGCVFIGHLADQLFHSKNNKAMSAK